MKTNKKPRGERPNPRAKIINLLKGGATTLDGMTVAQRLTLIEKMLGLR